MKKPLLSIGIIFKNDIRCIERCLKSLAPLRAAIPCELVMADTGSTDGSREIAEKYADLLIDFAWVNDFAAARNAVLDRCTGEWYITVDTDEWLDPEFDELTTFLRGKNRSCFELGSIIQRNYQDKQLRNYGDFFAMRMGRRCGGALRYTGPIHEYLTFPGMEQQERNLAFPHVVLHHDGYIEVKPGHIKEKLRRNMKLLKAELEKRPEDLRTLGQCVDSAETKEEKREYADRMYEILRRPVEKAMVSHLVAYQKITQVYYDEKEDDLLLECYQGWKNLCPESALLRMDGEALAAATEYRKKNYGDAIGHIRNYFQAVEEKADGKDLRSSDRFYSQYNTDNLRWSSNLLSLEFQCLCTLKRYSEANTLLRQVQQNELTTSDRCAVVRKVLMEAEQLPECRAFLNQCWEYLQDESHWEGTGEAVEQKKAVRDFLLMLQEHMEKNGQAGLDFVSGLDGIPGKNARILLSEDPEEISRLWEGVNEWEQIFPEACLHAMELGLPFPAGFYRQPSEQLSRLAAALAGKPGLPRFALDWLTHSAPPETPGELTWQLDLVTAALRSWTWKEEPEIGQRLCALYGELSALYLDTIYNPDLLTEEDLSVLPGMQRFGWHYQQALAAWEHDNELGYVRALRAGLKEAPAMKEMVEFLIEHKPKTAAQRQLEELAQQVRAILARYPAGDPAVAAIRQSEIYQKVAYLVEPQEQSEPQPPAAPVSPAALEEALAGSREEIADSARKNIGRWGPKNEEKRLNYWVKFPLWGKDREEVVENLSCALSEHGAEFRWLFDRLGDEQSRRILTAVLRSWRFFETKELGEVIETRYDDYFDLDLLRCDENEVVADLGAYTGDTFLSYVKNYGSMAYRRYYAYEITKESFAQLQKATAPYPRVVLRRKGAGDGPGVMTLDAGNDASANALSAAEGKTAETVAVVALDDDIAEPLTLIKMDIEGAEQSALRGCAYHVRADRPKLALSVYHNFEDLWKLPRMIEEYAPGYRFYLRYHGGNLWPSEITLLALPPQS